MTVSQLFYPDITPFSPPQTRKHSCRATEKFINFYISKNIFPSPCRHAGLLHRHVSLLKVNEKKEGKEEKKDSFRNILF